MSIYEEMNANTKQHIEQTFLALLAEKPFSKISVRDITTNAALNRGTFYLHYADKFDLLAQIETHYLQRLAEISQAIEPSIVLQEARDGEVSQFSAQVFAYIASDFASFRVLLSAHNESGFARRLQQQFKAQFLQKYAHTSFQQHRVPLHYVAAFAASAFLGMIEEWIQSDEQESPEQLADYFVNTILLIKEYE